MHAGTISHETAVAKAELEYDRFATRRAALPAPVTAQFDEAVRDAKQLEKARKASSDVSKAKPKGKRP